MITDDINKLVGDDPEAMEARARIHEPSSHDGYEIRVRKKQEPRLVFDLSLKTFCPQQNVQTLTFTKTKVVLSSGGSFWAWQYLGDKKIYL